MNYINFMATLFDEMRISVERGIAAALDGIRLLDTKPNYDPIGIRVERHVNKYNPDVMLLYRDGVCIGGFGVIRENYTIQCWLQLHGKRKYTKVHINLIETDAERFMVEVKELFDEFCLDMGI